MSPAHPAFPREAHDQEPVHRPRIAALACLGVIVVITIGLLSLPRETAQLPEIARQSLLVALPDWHTTEPVNEVVYGTRGMDTFGETFLLLAAVVSVLLITRRRERRHEFVGESLAGEREQEESDPPLPIDRTQHQARIAEAAEWADERSRRRRTPDRERVGSPAPETAETMTVITRTAARMVAPMLAVAGVYLFAEGYSPGGGFPAGAVALGVVLLIYSGFGYRRVSGVVRPTRLEIVELAGALGIIVVEVLGLILRGSFSANWVHLAPEETLRSGGVLQLFSIGEFFEVGTGLILVVFALMTMRHDWAPDAESGSS